MQKQHSQLLKLVIGGLTSIILIINLQLIFGFRVSLFPLEGVPDLPVAPQDEAGLTTTFQTWPRGWFHIPKDPDFPVPS